MEYQWWYIDVEDWVPYMMSLLTVYLSRRLTQLECTQIAHKLQEMYSELQRRHSKLQEMYSELQGRHSKLQEMYSELQGRHRSTEYEVSCMEYNRKWIMHPHIIQHHCDVVVVNYVLLFSPSFHLSRWVPIISTCPNDVCSISYSL